MEERPADYWSTITARGAVLVSIVLGGAVLTGVIVALAGAGGQKSFLLALLVGAILGLPSIVIAGVMAYKLSGRMGVREPRNR